MGVIRRGGKWCIRCYGPDGRQRWETIGPNKKEAETVLHQRLCGAVGCVVGGAGFEPPCCPHQLVPIDDDDLLGTA
jgi:hypothetical protein